MNEQQKQAIETVCDGFYHNGFNPSNVDTWNYSLYGDMCAIIHTDFGTHKISVSPYGNVSWDTPRPFWNGGESYRPCGVCGKPNNIGEMCKACGDAYHADGFEFSDRYHPSRLQVEYHGHMRSDLA